VPIKRGRKANKTSGGKEKPQHRGQKLFKIEICGGNGSPGEGKAGLKRRKYPTVVSLLVNICTKKGDGKKKVRDHIAKTSQKKARRSNFRESEFAKGGGFEKGVPKGQEENTLR